MDDINLCTFQRRLKKIIRGRDRIAVSELCELHKDAVRRYEKGEAEPKLSSAIAIAKTLNISLDYLTGLSDDPRRIE